jgi:hypothetical protein
VPSGAGSTTYRILMQTAAPSPNNSSNRRGC